MSQDMGPYNGKHDTHTEYQKAAFRKAKWVNGISNTRDPEKITDRNNRRKFVYQYEFDDDYRDRISIRLDNAAKYGNMAGNQKPHYNAGLQGTQLKQ